MKYLIDRLLPAEQVHILAGASGAGKTTLLFQNLRNWLDKKPVFGNSCDGGTLGYVAADRSLEEYEEKFELMKLKPFNILCLTERPDFNPDHLNDTTLKISLLSRIIKELNNPDLLVIDPLAPFLPNNVNDYHAVMKAMIALQRICKSQHCTIIGTHHATKLKDATKFVRPQDRILGSAALQGYSGTHLFLTDSAEIPNNPYRYSLFTIQPHNYPAQEVKYIRDHNGCFQEFEIPEDQLTDSIEFGEVLGSIPPPPASVSTAFIVEASGKAQSTVYRALGKLEAEGKIKKQERGRWSRINPS